MAAFFSFAGRLHASQPIREARTPARWPLYGCKMARLAAGRDIRPFVFNWLDIRDGQDMVGATGIVTPSNT